MNHNIDLCRQRVLRLAEENGIAVNIQDDAIDGYEIIKNDDKWKVIATNARSALWGIDHILTCREIDGLAGAYKPRFVVRGINLCESLARHSDKQLISLLNRMQRWRMNTLVIHSEYGYKKRREFIDRICLECGIERIFYTQTSLAFLKNAPDTLFAKDEDGKPLTTELCNGTRLCVSNPESLSLFEIQSHNFFKNLQIFPKDKILLMDADGTLFCRCKECQKIHPVDQWMKLFTIAVQQAEKLGVADKIEYLSYICRFRPPKDMDVFQNISGVMFDTHLRFRWKSLCEKHEFSDIQQQQVIFDSQLSTQCMNEYLTKMIMLWREKFSGRLYVFENLMMQFTLSTHQPCTRQLLNDVELFENINVDGIIYEAFEPGIESFDEQISLLAKAAWNENITYKPTRLDMACETFADEKSSKDIFGRNMSPLKYLETSQFQAIPLLKDAVNDPVLIEYEIRLQSFICNRDVAHWKQVISYLLEHKSRFDWMYIAFQLARQTPKEQWASIKSSLERDFLDTYKLWDFMEKHENPAEKINKICHKLLTLRCR